MRPKDRRNQGKHFVAPDPQLRDYEKEKPVFCLQYVDSAYCITKCSTEQRAGFASKIRGLSQLTWRQIRFAPKEGMGTEKIARSVIRRPIPEHITEDETLLAIRFHKGRMVGYKEREIFRIVWFDCDFSLYDH
jgi:hypothetical protein